MIFLLKFAMTILPVLVSVAFLTLLERKILGIVGFRKGPNKVSLTGILQPINDALKLSNKQINSISSFSYFYYYISSFFILSLSLMLWEIFSFSSEVVSSKNSMLLLMLIMSILSLKSISSGWSTFSKFSLMGSVRTLSMLITYESVMFVVLMIMMYLYNTFSLMELKSSNLENIFLFPLIFLVWLVSTMAELNRTPFDFSEGESELVSGFNTEFGSKCFTVLFLSEYSNIIFLSLMTSLIFFSLNVLYFIFLLSYLIWMRGVLPRYRYDKMMMFAWKLAIPIITLMLIFIILLT